MTYELPIEERVLIVQDHLKNIVRNRFNMTLTLGEQNALSEPSKETVASLIKQLNDFDSQAKFLNEELNSLKKQVPAEEISKK